MGKAPADQFYFMDYQRDTRVLSLEARGAWMDLLCAFWWAEPKGRLSLPWTAYARLFGSDEKTAQKAVVEIVKMGVCNCEIGGETVPTQNVTCHADVTDCLSNVTLVCRRHAKREKEREAARLRKQRQRAKPQCHKKVTSYSSSSSSSSSSNLKKLSAFEAPKAAHAEEPFYLTKKKHKLTGERLSTFEVFWKAFAYPKGKAEAAEVWYAMKPDNGTIQQIIDAANLEASRRPEIVASGRTPKMAQGWLTGRRWEDEDMVAVPESETGWAAFRRKHGVERNEA